MKAGLRVQHKKHAGAAARPPHAGDGGATGRIWPDDKRVLPVCVVQSEGSVFTTSLRQKVTKKEKIEAMCVYVKAKHKFRST